MRDVVEDIFRHAGATLSKGAHGRVRSKALGGGWHDGVRQVDRRMHRVHIAKQSRNRILTGRGRLRLLRGLCSWLPDNAFPRHAGDGQRSNDISGLALNTTDGVGEALEVKWQLKESSRQS